MLTKDPTVDPFVASANSDIETLQDEIVRKTDENGKQQDEIVRLSCEMRDIHRRLTELKKENEELKILISLTGKHRNDYETKVTNSASRVFAQRACPARRSTISKGTTVNV